MHTETMQCFAFLTLNGMIMWSGSLQIAVYSLVSHLLCELGQTGRSVLQFSHFQICYNIYLSYCSKDDRLLKRYFNKSK